MRVLMLGWEFPPYISGGLGTACFGLTRALSRHDVDITFILPHAGAEAQLSDDVTLYAPPTGSTGNGHAAQPAAQAKTPPPPSNTPDWAWGAGFEHVTFEAVESRMVSPYVRALIPQSKQEAAPAIQPAAPQPPQQQRIAHLEPMGRSADYSGNIVEESARYARLCLELTRNRVFDVIHAHDWMTFPAGMAIAQATGKPLIVHVHSTEYDRAGQSAQPTIVDVERRGMQAAVRVLAVSQYTRTILEKRYEIPSEHVSVVYNGIDEDQAGATNGSVSGSIESGDKIVLFLGRVTMQKGPDYFIRAAKKVLEKVDRVKFVIAGSGDMMREVVDMAARQGIGHKVLFTGFLRGPDVDRVYRMADVYVMPSVSEPFGIAALEAVRRNVPVIVSRTAGVSEVLSHVLKVDFWDVDQIADKIVAVLRHPPLGMTLRKEADIEVQALTWDAAAKRCRKAYDDAVDLMPV